LLGFPVSDPPIGTTEARRRQAHSLRWVMQVSQCEAACGGFGGRGSKVSFCSKWLNEIIDSLTRN